MSGLDYEGELFKDGLLTSVKVKSHAYDLVEVTFRKNLRDDHGVVITDSYYTMFYSTREFVDFFLPLFTQLKARIENDTNLKGQ
jgi:hypothetical protein